MTRLVRRRGLGFILLVAVALVCPPGVAYAASLNGTSQQVSGGFTAVAACGTLSSASVSWTVVTDTVVAARVSGLPAGCDGAVTSITLSNASSASVANASGVTISGGAATFTTLSANPDPATVVQTHFSAIGP